MHALICDAFAFQSVTSFFTLSLPRSETQCKISLPSHSDMVTPRSSIYSTRPVELFCPLGITRCLPQDMIKTVLYLLVLSYKKVVIDQTLFLYCVFTCMIMDLGPVSQKPR